MVAWLLATMSEKLDVSATAAALENETLHTKTDAAILPQVEQEPQLESIVQEQPAKEDVERKGPPPGAFNPLENPDGGTKAWLCAFGAFCCLFCSFGWINCRYTT